MSVRPHLATWAHYNENKGFYAVELINNGLGPAVIESFTVTVDGQAVQGEQSEQIHTALKMLLPTIEKDSHHSYLARDYAMAAKERCVLLALQFKGPQYPSKEFVDRELGRADLEVLYKSFYGEAYRLSTEEEKAKKPLPATALDGG